MRRKRYFEQHIGHISTDFIFILILLCVFAFGSLMSVILGANTYKSINADADSNFESRTTLSYIASKVRQSDEIDEIHIVHKNGVDALVLATDDNGEACETWIYEYDQHLYEVYIAKGTPFELHDGIKMIPSYGLDFDIDDGKLLIITSTDASGDNKTLTLSFRTNQGGAS
ncbi:MAG: DUF4860 domain-containing protein [Eubacteriales bacterium]|nr:DUF4860 domain-containing protein [Eubacteriales bacterium]MDD4390065.1 DUF4860 domain-containing protein [Eubacteriales bacterium]